MKQYNFTLLPEYDKRIKVGNQDFLGFSKKALKNHYANKNYIVVGEVKKAKTEKDCDVFVIGNERHSVKPVGTYNAIFNQTIGYVSVGNDNFVAIVKSRLAFLITVLVLLAGIAVAGIMLWNTLFGSDIPVISPNHPLPDVDSNIEQIENDNSGKPSQNTDGSGSVSMIYSLNAEISLSKGEINILFKNPQKSNQDVMLQLYITKDGNRTLIAESGRIPAGNMLRAMTLKSDAAILDEGVYEGVYKVIYYNSTTGDRAIVESDITNVEIKVKK